MDEYQRQDLLALRGAKNYRGYLAGLCAPYVTDRHVVEVGAGLGDFAEALLTFKPKTLTLLEPGAECFQELEQHPGIPATVRKLKRFSQDLVQEGAQFDCVIYNNVLEHIENDVEELRAAHRLLAPGGHLLILVPAHAWLFSEVDRKLGHFRRYTRPSLLSALRSAGFGSANPDAELRVHYINKIAVAGWLLNKWRGNTHQSQGMMRFFDRALLPVSRRLDAIFPKTFGSSLFASVVRAPTES